jgi:hypothetical protein
MHKQEIIDAYGVGMNDGCSYMTDGKTEFENREQYYQETFGSGMSEKPTNHIEISDEDIIKGAEEWYDKEGAYKPSGIALITWLNACKWYRKKLKQKTNG